MVVEELIIKEEGKEIYGTIYYPEKEGKYPAIILSHGFNGSYADFDKECTYYADNGFIAYTFDFCGGALTSKSSGTTREMTIFTEKEDLTMVLNFIRNMDCVEENEVYLFGGSHGGLVTSLVAAEQKEYVRAVAMYFPALCVIDNWNKAYPMVEDIPETTFLWEVPLGKDYFMTIRDFNIFEEMKKYEGPVLILHGDEDEIVPLEYSKKATENYKNGELVVLPGEKHGFSPEGIATCMEKILQFMEEKKETTI